MPDAWIAASSATTFVSGRIDPGMADAIVTSILIMALLAVIVLILWLSIVRWDLIDKFATREDLPFKTRQIYPKPTEKQRSQQELYVRYIKAKHSGVPFDEDEFSELPGYMRSDRLRRTWYAFLGLALASFLGVIGGLFIYESTVRTN